MDARSCRYAALVEVLAVIDGAVLDGELPPCDQPAAFVAVVLRERRGEQVPIRTRCCTEHDAGFRAYPGYHDSIELPHPSFP